MVLTDTIKQIEDLEITILNLQTGNKKLRDEIAALETKIQRKRIGALSRSTLADRILSPARLPQ